MLLLLHMSHRGGNGASKIFSNDGAVKRRFGPYYVFERYMKYNSSMGIA